MIFLLAIDILPIQGSSVPCKHIFLSSKETTTARRNCISSTLMEALQILKFAIRNGLDLSFTQGTGLQDKLKALEGPNSEPPPNDLVEFV